MKRIKKQIIKKTKKVKSRKYSGIFSFVFHPVSVIIIFVLLAFEILAVLFLNKAPFTKNIVGFKGLPSAYASYYNPCANANCGGGGYCGGNCGVVGPGNYVYQCTASKGTMISEEYCNNGCYTNPSGSDRCNSGTSATASTYNQCGNTTGACVNPQIQSTHLVAITKNAQNTSGNWLCTDKGVSSSCPTPTPTPNPCAGVQGASTHVLGASVASNETHPATHAMGVPAINPISNPSTTTSTTFDLNHAQAYVGNHPFLNGVTTTGKPSSVASIFFATDAQVTAMTNGEDPGLSPNATVLVVIENGPFSLTNVPLPPGDTTVPVANQVIRVYDAKTGNYLMWGDYRGGQ